MLEKKMVVVFLGVLSVAGVAQANLSNPDFESPLSPWWTANIGGSVNRLTDGTGDSFAILLEPEIPGPSSSSLYQDFIITPGLASLTFEYTFESQNAFIDDGVTLPDAFTARLLDSVTLNPLVGTTSYFYHDARGASDSILYDGSIVTRESIAARPDWFTVSVDLTGVAAGTSTRLQFDLFGTGLIDGQYSFAGVDNLKTETVPAPSAVVLGLIGLGIVNRLRRGCVSR